jgi:DNA excision repair protein ERCC-4
MSEPFTFPAKKSLGELAGCKPVIVIDSREQTPLVFTRLESRTSTLYSADYSVAGLEELVAIERKSVADLIGCCIGENRERFERELHRLRGYRFKRLVIVGDQSEINLQRFSRITPRAVFASLSAWEIRFDIPVIWMATPELAARQIESWAFWYAREIVKAANALLPAS